MYIHVRVQITTNQDFNRSMIVVQCMYFIHFVPVLYLFIELKKKEHHSKYDRYVYTFTFQYIEDEWQCYCNSIYIGCHQNTTNTPFYL